MSVSAPTPVTGYSDEIDLFELAQDLWRQRLLIGLVTAVVVAVAAGYAFLSTPIYESKVSFQSPSAADIAGYNLGRSDVGLREFTVKKVYSVFIQNLRSEGVRRDFFEQVYLPVELANQGAKTQVQLWDSFNKELTITNSDMRNSPERFEVVVRSIKASQAADWANLYVERVAEKTRQNMMDTIHAEIGARTKSIKSRIVVLRASARKLREDRINRLREALLLAPVKSSRPSSDGELEQLFDDDLLYMRGTKAIRAELEMLQSRKNDDPFITGLRELESQLDFLSFLSQENASAEGVAVFTLDSAAEVPETPVKPKKVLILAFGLVLGGMLGVFVAFIRSMLGKRSESIA